MVRAVTREIDFLGGVATRGMPRIDGSCSYPIGHGEVSSACTFYGHVIAPAAHCSCIDDCRVRYFSRSLTNHSVCTQKPISSSMSVARDVSKFMRLFSKQLHSRESLIAAGHFTKLGKDLRAVFAPVFMSRGESAKDLIAIESFLKDLFSKIFDEKDFHLACGQCFCILKQGGAMALFGMLNSAISLSDTNQPPQR